MTVEGIGGIANTVVDGLTEAEAAPVRPPRAVGTGDGRERSGREGRFTGSSVAVAGSVEQGAEDEDPLIPCSDHDHSCGRTCSWH